MVIEEVLPGVFRIEVPLPKNPLRSNNCYVIRGQGGPDLIVDTGMAKEESRTVLRKGLREVGVDLGTAEFFITHLHIDHVALAKELAAPNARVYLGAADTELIRSWNGWERLLELAHVHGFPADKFRQVIEEDRDFRFDPDAFPEFTPIRGDESFIVGDYRLSCLPSPGHSPGHMCLYESTTKTLFTGDHVLGEVSPNITGWSPSLNPLETYLHSLDQVRGLDVGLVLPGHREVFHQLAARVDELKAHHDERLQEVLEIISEGERTAYEVAAVMDWDLKVKSWQEWPLAQQWFATGEALSHLRCLVKRRKLSQRQRGEFEVFSTGGGAGESI